MKKKHRILFIVPALYGHLGPSLPIAKNLIQKGHTVAYCSGPPAKKLLRDAGIVDFYPREKYHPAIMEATLVKNIYEYWHKLSKTFTPEIIRQCLIELINAFERFNPDVVYIDTYDVLAEVVAEKFSRPYAHGSATVILYFEKGIPPVGSGWSLHTPLRNRLKWIPYFTLTVPFILKTYLNERKALKSIDPGWRRKNISSVSPYLYMLYSTDMVEYHRSVFIPQVFYVGPSILYPDKDQAPDFPWEKIDKNRPLIYIATGTLFNEYYKNFYKNVVKALSDNNFPKPIQVVMAMGKQEFIDELGEIPPNFIVVPFAPQIKLLQKASVVVTHGGVNSVNEALIYGKPMLVVHCGMDRVDMGRRITEKGAGICFGFNKASVRRIKESILRLLDESEFTSTAEKIMLAYKRCNGASTAAELILRLADTGKPILRKKGTPITIEDIKNLPEYLE